MNGEMCEHVANSQGEPVFTLAHKETGKKHSFCRDCLISFLRREGEDPSQFVIGYNVYRSTDPNLPKDQWQKLNETPVPGNHFRQERSQGEPGKTYYYYVTAVSALGMESPPSDVTSATIPLSVEDETEWPTSLN